MDRGKGQNLPPTLAIDALIGEVEQNRKQEEEQKKETESGPPIQLLWTI